MIPTEIKEFIAWKDHPLCPFSVHYNGEKPKGHRIYYAQTEKGITIDELFLLWQRKYRKVKVNSLIQQKRFKNSL